MTARDEQMFEWFSIVRIASMQSVRWVLGALNGWSRPVSERQAQSWCARMRVAGKIGQAQLGLGGGSVVWATFAAVGRSKPDLFRQNTKHELAVAAVSARYAAAGYAWERDERPATTGGHQADGVAFGTDWAELIEVELTGKRLVRYGLIFEAHCRRLDRGDADRLTYVCSTGGARAVKSAMASLSAGRALAGQVRIEEVFDRAAQWTGDRLPDWLLSADVAAGTALKPSPR